MNSTPLLVLGFFQAEVSNMAVQRSLYWGLTASEWITIVAIVVGPIFAVVTQFVWQRVRSRRDLRMWVFGTLMSHRGSPANFEFVKAVNYIDVIFYKSKKIRDRWQAVLAHLSSDAYKQENFTPAAFQKFRDLLAQLLAEMADELGYKFDHLHIKENAWQPSLHGWELEENIKLRRGLIEVVEGRRGLNVALKSDSAPYQPQPPTKAVALAVSPTLEQPDHNKNAG